MVTFHLFIYTSSKVIFKGVVVSVHIMKEFGGVGVYLHIFLALVCGGNEWSASHDSHSTPQGRALAPLNCRQGGPPRFSLDALEKRRIS